VKNRPGVALLLVLWVIVMLGTIASSVAVATRSTSKVAATYRAQIVGRYAAESGIALASALLEESLVTLTDSAARRDYLNHLDRAMPGDEIELASGRAAVKLVDVGSRLDLNTASVESLGRLFSFFADANSAQSAARAVHARLPITTLDELARIPELTPELAERIAQYLTVDGDGSINRLTASDTVLAAAGGDLRDEPTRILVTSRGWREGQPGTHEIQAVYAIQNNALAMVRWRERQR
jgi:type II secretory pathway component PulK